MSGAENGTAPMAGVVALVTSMAEQGARSHAAHLASLGATVVVHDPDQAAAEAAARTIGSGRCSAAPLGALRSPDDAQALVSGVVEAHGRLDALVECSGALETPDDGPGDAASRRVRERLLPAAWVIDAARAVMHRRRAGRIVGVLSSTATLGHRAAVDDALVAGGLLALLRSSALAAMAEPGSVGVNGVTVFAHCEATRPLFDARPGMDPGRYRVDLASPVVAHLAQPGCALRGEVLSVTGGRLSRLYLASPTGAFDPGRHELGGPELAALLADEDIVTELRCVLHELALVEV